MIREVLTGYLVFEGENRNNINKYNFVKQNSIAAYVCERH